VNDKKHLATSSVNLARSREFRRRFPKRGVLEDTLLHFLQLSCISPHSPALPLRNPPTHIYRTVADGTCSFPSNFFGCETAAARYTGGVKYIAEDYELECEVSC
jgi:hypothetical protein